MSTADQLATGLTRLKSRIGDRVLGPEDPGFDEARRPWNLAVNQHPAAVARPESTQDVVAVVDVAREHGLRVAPQGTGHNASPRTSLEASVLLDMSDMNAVEIDAERRLARLQAGAQWQHVVGPAAAHERSRWREEPEDDASDRGVDAGLMHGDPCRARGDDVRC